MKLIDLASACRHVSPEMKPRVVRAAEGAGGRVLWMDFLDMGSSVFAVMPAGTSYTGPSTTPECVHVPVDTEAEQDWFDQFLAGGEDDFVRLVCDVHDCYGRGDVLLKDALAVPGGFVALRYVPGSSHPKVDVVRRALQPGGTWESLTVNLEALTSKFSGTFWGTRLLAEAPHYLAALPYLTEHKNACMNANSHALNPAPIMRFLSTEDEEPFRELMQHNARAQHMDFGRGYGMFLLTHVAKRSFSQEVFDAFEDGSADPLALDFTRNAPADMALAAGNLPAIRAFARASTRRGDEAWWLDRLHLLPEMQDVIRAEVARTKARMALAEILA